MNYNFEVHLFYFFEKKNRGKIAKFINFHVENVSFLKSFLQKCYIFKPINLFFVIERTRLSKIDFNARSMQWLML